MKNILVVKKTKFHAPLGWLLRYL